MVKLLLSHPNIDVNKKFINFLCFNVRYDSMKHYNIEDNALSISLQNHSIEIIELLLSHPRIDCTMELVLQNLFFFNLISNEFNF